MAKVQPQMKKPGEHAKTRTASDGKGCCTPGREAAAAAAVPQRGHPRLGDSAAPSSVPASVTTTAITNSTSTESPDTGAQMIALDGGTFLMGSNDPAAHPHDGEGPVREVTVSPFRIDAIAVTNERFQRFVDATGYQTEAEQFGWSFVFAGLLPDDHPPTRAVQQAPWWRQVYGAAWNAPEGPGSSVANRLDHPAVHISHSDALAYCAWAGARLPTEAEWEFAARGGLHAKAFPWGDELTPDGRHRCNIWQGRFPEENTAEDGFVGTAPVTAYEPNGFGLMNTVGNTWEWCTDWFDPRWHADPRNPRVNPKGPPRGAARVTKGGSYLCHRSYCYRYRVGARSGSPPDTGTGNTGFRIVIDIKEHGTAR